MPKSSRSARADQPVPSLSPEAPVKLPPQAPDSNAPSVPSPNESADTQQPTNGSRTPDPFALAADYTAGVHLLESRKFKQVQLKFDAKPPQMVIEHLRDAGYQWHPADKVWAKQMTKDNAHQTRVEAERLFQECVDAIQIERGAGPGR